MTKWFLLLTLFHFSFSQYCYYLVQDYFEESNDEKLLAFVQVSEDRAFVFSEDGSAFLFYSKTRKMIGYTNFLCKFTTFYGMSVYRLIVSCGDKLLYVTDKELEQIGTPVEFSDIPVDSGKSIVSSYGVDLKGNTVVLSAFGLKDENSDEVQILLTTFKIDHLYSEFTLLNSKYLSEESISLDSIKATCFCIGEGYGLCGYIPTSGILYYAIIDISDLSVKYKAQLDTDITSVFSQKISDKKICLIYYAKNKIFIQYGETTDSTIQDFSTFFSAKGIIEIENEINNDSLITTTKGNNNTLFISFADSVDAIEIQVHVVTIYKNKVYLNNSLCFDTLGVLSIVSGFLDTNSLFYVYKEDGMGDYYFSTTFGYVSACRSLTKELYSNKEFDLSIDDLFIENNYNEFKLMKIVLTGSYGEVIDDRTFHFPGAENGSLIVPFYLAGEGFNSINSETCFIEISICHPSCQRCTKYSEDPSNPYCTNCPTNTYPLVDDNSKCNFKTDEVERYFFDVDNGMFMNCYSSCKTCSQRGTAESQNCLSCNEGYVYAESIKKCILFDKNCEHYWNLNEKEEIVCYDTCPPDYPHINGKTKQCSETCSYNENGKQTYPLEDNPLECHSQIEDVEGYYFDPELEVFGKCYGTCKTCERKGTSDSNNCLSCIDDLEYDYENNLCEPPCDKSQSLWYYDGKKLVCTLLCTQKYPYVIEYLNECVPSCSKTEFYTKTYEFNCLEECPEQTIEIKLNCYEIPKITLLDIIENLNDIILNLYEVFPTYSFENATYSLYKETFKEENQAQKMQNLSTIEFGPCVKRNFFASRLDYYYVFQVDFIRDDNIFNQVEYSLFTPEGTPVDLSECLDDYVIITNPFVEDTQAFPKFSEARSLSQQGYNFFDLNDRLYTDVCASYETKDNVDVPTKERKAELLEGKVIYEEGCIFRKENITEKKIVLRCDLKQNFSYFPRNFSNSFFDEPPSHQNFKTIKCSKAFFNSNIIKNGGFWIYSILIVFSVFLFLFYFHYKMKPAMFDQNFSAFQPNLSSTMGNLQPQIIGGRSQVVNLSSLNAACPPTKNTENGNEFELKALPNTKTINSNVEKKKEEEDLVCVNKVLNRKNFTEQELLQHITNAIKKKSSSQNFNASSNVVSYSGYDSSKNAKLKEQKKTMCTKASTTPGEKGGTLKSISEEELNVMPLEESLLFDQRTPGEFYQSLLKYKEKMLYTFTGNSSRRFLYMKCLILIFTIGLIVLMNVVFFSDSNLSDYYYRNGKYYFFTYLPQIIYSTIICAVAHFLACLFAFTEETLKRIVKIRKKNPRQRIFFDLRKGKGTVFFLFEFALLGFSWYYTGAFCAVFKNVQKYLFLNAFISFIFLIVYPLIFCMLTMIFRFCGLRNKSKILFGISRFLQFF